MIAPVLVHGNMKSTVTFSRSRWNLCYSDTLRRTRQRPVARITKKAGRDQLGAESYGKGSIAAGMTRLAGVSSVPTSDDTFKPVNSGASLTRRD
mmetsp:Transcript_53318/g.142699  ORF Transcript_53318/g.142699 Transcript_53318/m.142699 type:complete len:94 (-) Transcript_53318:57-338(-)